MNEIKFWALHGFLGLPSDWKILKTEVEALKIGVAGSIKAWAHQFNREMETEGTGYQNILLGYSLGGRLLLQAFVENPNLWKGAVLISTHPGYLKEEDVKKRERRESDAMWAYKFSHLSWEDVMKEWNANQVFSSTVNVERKEKDYSRFELASHLRNFSLADQEDLVPLLALIDLPVFWLVGERDEKFVEASKRVKLKNPDSEIAVIPEVGHRLLWEAPQEVDKFLLKMNRLQG